LFVVGSFVAAGVAQAQTAGTISLQANPASATGSAVPVLTWSTNPVAQNCIATGGWSGPKAVAGTETLSEITVTTSYTLTCTWGSGSTTITWVAPTTNTDGSALIDLAGFRILFGKSSTTLTNSAVIDDMTQRSATTSALTTGEWFFAVRAFNIHNGESDNSNVVSKTVTGDTDVRTVNVTIVAPPSLLTIATSVFDVVQQSDGSWSPRAVVGSIAIGRPCSEAFTATGGFFEIDRDDVTFNGESPWSNTLVARCATS
jgi:hypothetical protein